MATPYSVMMGLILILTPLVCWFFSYRAKDSRVPVNKFAQTIHDNRYYLHIFGYAVIIKWKAITDNLNEPIKSKTGNWTEYVYALEGDLARHVQTIFENDILTDILNFHYLFIYLFLIYVTTVFYAYVGERDLTDKVTLNYLLIYAVAVPYYLFFNVEVTSSWIPEMKALLYHEGWYTDFYVTHDPLDNAVPSLHVAIPFGILMLNWLHVKEKGGKMTEWEHWPYHLFILINTIVFCFSIIYLGIHWFIDIPLGMIVGGIGALFIHYIQPRLRSGVSNFIKSVSRKYSKKRVASEGFLTAVLFALLLGSVSLQSDQADELTSFRLGEGDTTFEIIPEISDDEGIITTITNLDSEQPIQVMRIDLYESIEFMDRDGILWDQMVEKHGENITIQPGGQATFETKEKMRWMLVIFHLPDNGGENIVELNVVNDYAEDPITKALLMSLISLWITAFVVFRIYRLKRAGMSFISSQPSDHWDSSSE